MVRCCVVKYFSDDVHVAKGVKATAEKIDVIAIGGRLDAATDIKTQITQHNLLRK